MHMQTAPGGPLSTRLVRLVYCQSTASLLLQAGTWTTLRKGATLQEEGQPSASVFLLVSGGADVAVGGENLLLQPQP